VGSLIFVGKKLGSAIVKIDEKGRVVLPKNIRETANLKEGNYVTIKAEGKTIIMEPTEPVADKYYGAFKVTKWPENMDEFIVEVINKWWSLKAT
jgi:AbrB family looped-hinge helix DNA binding protein